VILRGKTFNVGDRIVMGGVRGDVVALSFMQTTIMEMGQPPVQSDGPAFWVHSRQYTGGVVTVSNAKVFDEPVYNYSRDFPYIREELSLPVRYQDDRAKAEQILLKAARKHSADIARLAEADLAELSKRYRITGADVAPRVFWRLTEARTYPVRFLTRDHGTRELKDSMSRDAKRVKFGRPTRIGGNCCSHCGFLNRINIRRRYFFIITARWKPSGWRCLSVVTVRISPMP